MSQFICYGVQSNSHTLTCRFFDAQGSILKLKLLAAEQITLVKESVTIDWTLREGARAKSKVMVKRILNFHGYPPDLQEEAVKTVLAQAELLCDEWV